MLVKKMKVLEQKLFIKNNKMFDFLYKQGKMRTKHMSACKLVYMRKLLVRNNIELLAEQTYAFINKRF